MWRCKLPKPLTSDLLILPRSRAKGREAPKQLAPPAEISPPDNSATLLQRPPDTPAPDLTTRRLRRRTHWLTLPPLPLPTAPSPTCSLLSPSTTPGPHPPTLTPPTRLLLPRAPTTTTEGPSVPQQHVTPAVSGRPRSVYPHPHPASPRLRVERSSSPTPLLTLLLVAVQRPASMRSLSAETYHMRLLPPKGAAPSCLSRPGHITPAPAAPSAPGRTENGCYHRQARRRH